MANLEPINKLEEETPHNASISNRAIDDSMEDIVQTMTKLD